MQGLISFPITLKLWSWCYKNQVLIPLTQHISIDTDLFFPLIPGKYGLHLVVCIFFLCLKRYKGACSSQPQHQNQREKDVCFVLVFKDAVIISCSPRKMRLDDNLSPHFTIMTSKLLKPHYWMSLLCACVHGCVNVGLREQEILSRRWHSVDFHGFLWRLIEF